MDKFDPGLRQILMDAEWGSGHEAEGVLAHGLLTMVVLDFFKVIRMTGFMKGLYTDAEMKSDNVKVGLSGGPPARLNEWVFL